MLKNQMDSAALVEREYLFAMVCSGAFRLEEMGRGIGRQKFQKKKKDACNRKRRYGIIPMFV